MTADPQHFFVDALTGADGTGAAKSRLDVPTVFPDATAAFTPRALTSRSTKTQVKVSQAATSQQPYPLPGPLTPSRQAQATPGRANGPASVSPDIPYNPWPLATTMDVVAAPVPPAAIPAPPVNRPQGFQSPTGSQRPPTAQRPLNSQRPANIQRPSAYGRTISQEAAAHPNVWQGQAQHGQPPLPPPNQSGHQVPAALMAWLPPSVAAQIPAANRPAIAQDPRIGSQPQQQRPTQQFSAPQQPNFRQQQQVQAQRANRKSGGAGAFVIVLLLFLIFTGLGREILDAIIDAFNK